MNKKFKRIFQVSGIIVGIIVLFFIGIIGEYIGAIYTQVKNRPLVIEKERINFDPDDMATDKD